MDFVDIGDATNVTGMSKLFNANKISEEVNLDSIEKDIIGNLDELTVNKGQQSLEEYQRELDDLTRDIGGDNSGGGGGPDIRNPLFQSAMETASSGGADDDDEVKSVISNHQPYLKHAFQGMDTAPPEDREFSSFAQRRTQEEQNKAVIDNALSGIRKEAFSLQKVKDEERKYRLISNIDQILTALKSYKVDVKDVKIPTQADNLEDIEVLYKSLLYKFDAIRYTETGMNVMTLFVYGLEWLFDGKKKYFGVKPNLSGWHSTASVKMQRVSFPISQKVSAIMNDYDYDDAYRIALELIPSAFIHMKNKADESSGGTADTMVTQDEVRDALNDLEMQNKDYDV